MNVFALANEYRQLEALIDAEIDVPEADLIDAWLTVEGDLNHKIENIGFCIRNREAVLAGIQAAIMAMEGRSQSAEKEIERFKKLAITLMAATNLKKAGGSHLTLSIVANAPKVEIIEQGALQMEYMREIPAVAASWAPDKKKIGDDLKLGVVIEGARLVPSVRLAIR